VGLLRGGIDGTTEDVTADVDFGVWQSVPANGDGILLDARATAETDGTTDGLVQFEIDRSGDGNSNYEPVPASAPSSFSDGFRFPASADGVFIPPGGQYKIINTSDPNGANTIDAVRETTL
jgi:hypothetical protein